MQFHPTLCKATPIDGIHKYKLANFHGSSIQLLRLRMNFVGGKSGFVSWCIYTTEVLKLDATNWDRYFFKKEHLNILFFKNENLTLMDKWLWKVMLVVHNLPKNGCNHICTSWAQKKLTHIRQCNLFIYF